MTPKEVIDKIFEDQFKFVTVDVDSQFIHIDKMKDGKWRIVMTKNLLNEKS